MRKLLIIGVLLLQSSLVLAREVSLSEVLEWKYGFVANTEQVDPTDLTSAYPEMKITAWRHKTLPIPTQKQIETAKEEYKAYLEQKEIDDSAKQAELKSRLRLSEDDIQTIRQILR